MPPSSSPTKVTSDEDSENENPSASPITHTRRASISNTAIVTAKKATAKKKVKKYGVKKKRREFQFVGKSSSLKAQGLEIKKYRGANQAIEPEDGINSRSWAEQIAPQDSAFLRLPLEVREQILSYVISALNNFRPIAPHRRNHKFYHPSWPTATTEINNVSSICKQLYVEVISSGLLYRYKTFLFTNADFLKGFLWALRPSHHEVIRSVHMRLRHHGAKSALASTSFIALVKLKGLKHLHVGFTFNQLGRPYSASRIDYCLQLIKDCVELRSIKDLASFQLRIFAGEWMRHNLQLVHRLRKDVQAVEDDLKVDMLASSEHSEVRASNDMLMKRTSEK